MPRSGEVTEEQAVKIVDEMFAIPEHWRHEDMKRGEATHVTKYSLAVETKHENDRLIASLQELGKDAITWNTDEKKVRSDAGLKLTFWCSVRLSRKQRANGGALEEATDALKRALVGALNSAKDTWVQGIIAGLEAESQSAVQDAVDEINWLHSQIGDESVDAVAPDQERGDA